MTLLQFFMQDWMAVNVRQLAWENSYPHLLKRFCFTVACAKLYYAAFAYVSFLRCNMAYTSTSMNNLFDSIHFRIGVLLL